MDERCVFCAIVAGKAPASFVYEGEDVVAFMDINPVNAGHLLVIPRAHATYLSDLNEGAGGEMMAVAMRLQRAIRESALPCEGVNLFVADGEVAGQEVFHVHLHVIPRLPGDGFKLGVEYGPPPSRSDLDRHAAAIRAGLH